MHPRARTRFTVAEYLAVDAVSDQKNEYVDGYILGRPVTGRAHNLITANICVALGAALRGERRWEVYGCEQRVGDAGRGWFAYPDGVVACAPVAFDGHTLLDPRVVVEVLSPGTAAYDRGDKLRGYLALPSVSDVLLVAEDARRVAHHRRVGAGAASAVEVTAGGVAIGSLGVEVALGEIYRGVELPG